MKKLRRKDRVRDSERYSIVTSEMHRCYVCGRLGGMHKHEIFFGSGLRELSKLYGLVVPLCGTCHETGKDAVHKNRELDLHLKAIGQKAFEKHYPKESFLEVFGRNYL